ncbi:MAG: hypothetical protein ABH885_06960, partial [Candidatus Omnitrophota bacterium]
RLKGITAALPDTMSYTEADTLSPSQRYKPDNPYDQNIERRQHTPQGLKTIAGRHGFAHEAFYGVHPHIIAPPLNKLLPPKLYNTISKSLEALEHLPVSLTWSSQFIGVFRKK